MFRIFFFVSIFFIEYPTGVGLFGAETVGYFFTYTSPFGSSPKPNQKSAKKKREGELLSFVNNQKFLPLSIWSSKLIRQAKDFTKQNQQCAKGGCCTSKEVTGLS